MKFFADDSKMYAEITDIADVIIIIIHEFHRDASLEQNFRAAMCHRHVLHYSCNVNAAVVTRLQAALDSMVQWAETGQLKLTTDKCCVLHIGQYQTASSSVISSLHSYKVCGHQLLVVTHCCDLGVIIANGCQPRLHINTVVAKASQRAHAILRCFQSRDPCVLLPAFKVYVRLILKFTEKKVQKKSIEAIEKVQRRFTKRLSGLRLRLLRTSTDVKSSKFGTTKDTLQSHSDLSNSLWSHSTEM